MRIWDINAGYLNRQSLLGEHRELHGIVSIIKNAKKGYSNHPETIRWVGYEWAIMMRHSQLAAEMYLRGYNEKSPVEFADNQEKWPDVYIDEPASQYAILSQKYIGKESGRIPLPTNAQELWRHHKYSIMARDVNLYKKIGKEVAIRKDELYFNELASLLVDELRKRPSSSGMKNAMQHMWGYVSGKSTIDKSHINKINLKQLLELIQEHTIEQQQMYILESTAISEFYTWLN